MEENKFVPPSDAVVTKSKKNNFVPPTDAIVKKKVASKRLSQEELWGSSSQPQDLFTSLATGKQVPQQASDVSDGQPDPIVKKSTSVLFPETPMGRPKSVMYGDGIKQPVLIESTPLDTKPKKYYRIVSDEKKAVEKQIADLEERNIRLGRRPEDLTNEGTYQALQKQKAQLDKEFEPAQRAIREVKKDVSLLGRPFEGIVSGLTKGKYTYVDTEVINLDKDVEDKIIDKFDAAPKETKEKWYKGQLERDAKESIINSAKNDVINETYSALKQEANDYVKYVKNDPNIPIEEKLKFQKEFKDKSDAFNSKLAIEYSGKLLKNNFKRTDDEKDLDEGILSKYEGFVPETLDILSTFAEGMGQTSAKVATGIPSLVLIGAEKLNQLTGISKPDDYTSLEATEDWINDTTNLNFLPSSQIDKGELFTKKGDSNFSYYSIGKTLAKTLPFTLKIMSDVKKGRIEDTPQSMISQLINPKYNKDFADKLRVVETAYKGTIADNYRDAKEMGMDDSKSFLYANVMSLAEGVSENIMPDFKYFDSLTGATLKSAFKGNLKDAVTKQAVKNVTKDFFKNMAFELGEEEVVLATEDALKYSLLLNHKNSEFANWKRQKELAATTVLLSGALGSVSINQKYKQNKKDLYNSIHNNIYDLQDAFLDEIDSPLNDQKAKEALMTAYKYANDVSIAVSNAPENVTADQIDLLVQKKNLEEKKKTIDTAFHPDINEEIAGIDAKIRELAKIPVVEAPAVEEVAPAVKEVTPAEVAVKPSGQKVADIINRPATLESQAGVKLETPIEGDVYQEDQRVIFEDKNKKTYDLGNIDEVSDKTVEELGIKPQEEMVSITPEGKVKVGENQWNMQLDLPTYGIEYDNDGNVKAVSLKDDAGKTVMYEGQVAEDAAYQVLLSQAETPEQRQAINEILENDEELNRQLREAEEAAKAAAAEVTEPGAQKTQAEQYSEELDKTKESDPETYWSVSPVSAKDAAKGTIIDTPDGAAIVKPDGDIAGLFKKSTSKAKGVAQDLLKRAVAAGGKKLDNFDTYLTPQYIKAGFRVVSRVPFNEEYAPEGWNKEKHGTPDVVAMVYDPEGKLDIEEKTFDDYEEAMAYRDSLLEPSIDAELEGLAKLFDESDKGFRMSQVDNAKKALDKILPGVKFIVHETNEAYNKAVGDNSSGTYIMYSNGDKVIHINKKNANGRTVAHEVFHAVILDKIKGEKAVQEITARMVDAVYKTASPELKAKLDAFAARYSDKTIRDEERLAELIGLIADGYPQMSPANKNIVKRWLDSLAKMFGLKPFTDNEVIDLLNTLAGKISTGEVISAEDVAMFKAKEKGIINKIRRQLSEDESTNIAKEVVSKTVKGKSIPTWIQKKTKAKEKFVSFSGEINQENVKINAPASYNTVASKLSNYNTFNIDVKQELKDNLIGAEKSDINKILENNKKKLESKIKSLSKEVDKVKKKKVSEDFSKEEKLATIQSLQDSIKHIKDIVKTKDLNDQLNMVLDIKSKTIKDSLYKDLFYGLGKNAKKLTDKELVSKSEDIYNKSKDIVKANLLSVYNSVSPTIRKISKLWYDGANLIAQDMSKKYGVTNEQSAAIIATQSPQMPWFDNLHLADVIMDLMSSKKDDIFTKELFNYYVSKSKKYAAQVSYIPTLKESVGKKLSELSDKDAAIFIRSYYDTKLSRKAPIRIPTGTSIDIDQTGDSSFSGYDVIAKGVSIFRDGSIENISNQLGEANKVRNFYMNIADPSDKRAVTIDTHAMAIALFKPLASNDYEVNFDPATFAFYADAYRELAVELGIEARALQSITWEAARAIFPAEKKAKPGYKAKISGLWDKLSKGEQTIKGIQEDIYKEANDPNITEWSEYINVLKDEKARKNVSGRIVELEGAKDSSKLGDVSGDNIGVSRDGRGTTVPGKGTEIKRSQLEENKIIPAGNRLFNKPLPEAKDIADKYYKKTFGKDREEFKGTRELDKENAKRISDAFIAMKHDPNNPKVKASYKAMAKETLNQYKYFLKSGYKIEINNEEPYSNSEAVIEDLRNNKRIKIFSTESGFGDNPITAKERSENPLLKDSGYKDANGQPLLINDVFRAVHDFFGHVELGNSFGPLGEENAWNVHARMYSDIAKGAVTTETRGQNSYVNFSGVNKEIDLLREKARKFREEGNIEEADKITNEIYEKGKFADQKVGLLPEEFTKFPEVKTIERLQHTNDINEIVRIAKEANYSDAAISAFLKAKGFSDAEIASALSKLTTTEDEAYEKFRSEAKKSREEITNKKTVKEYLKEKYQNIIKNWSNRQVEAQSLLSKTGMVNTLNLIINSHGYSGKAKRMFQESYDKIYKGLSTEKRNILDEVIQAKRFIAIDNNRADRGLDPVKHPNYLNKQESQMFLDKLKKEIGDKEFNDITARSDEYFSTYKKLLKDVYENGLISKESYESMSDLDYQPRVFLQFVTDFDGDLKTPKNSVDSTSLSSDQIKSMKEGDVNSLVTNSEWLLSNSLVARTNAMAKNNINRRFMTDEFPKAKERFDKLDPRNLKGDDVRFYKYFKDLQSKVIDNPIIGYTKDGNPKYKYDDLKSPLNFTKAYYYVDGVQHQFFLEDGLHKSWNDNVDGFISRDAKEMLSYASGSALVKAIATGNNPAFPIVNTPRDFMFTAAFSDEYSNLTPLALGQIGLDVIKSIKEISKKDSDIVNKYYEYGGAMDFLSSQGVLKKDSLLGTFIDKMVPPNVKDNTKTVFNAVTLKKISEYSELMFRLGIFQRSVNNSLKELGVRSMSEIDDKQQVDDIYNAAVASARGILDFNKGGVASKDLESIIPYINVAFQGGSVALNAFKKNPVATTSRLFQIATMASTIPAGLSLFLIAANKGDDDEDKTAHEIYLDAIAGVSKYQKSKYMNIVTGEKNEDGQYKVIKIAKAQELSPVISVTDDITENMIRKVAGKEPKSNETIVKNAMFSLKNNVLPFDVTSPSGTIVRNPVAKAILTYQTGYDFFRDQPLAMGLESKPAPYEGLDMKSVEGFYKDLGPKYGLSPVRSKAFVESLITTPDTNPFVGMFYGGAEAMSSNKDAKGIGKDLVDNVYKSTGKRVISYTSDFNRNIEAKQKLEKQIDDIKLKDAILKSEIKLASDRFIANDITKDQLMEEFKDLDPFDKKRAMMKIRDKKMMKDVDSNILDIKYEKSARVKALMIENYYGNILDKSDNSKEIIIQMRKAGNILTPEVIFELKKNTQ